MPRACKHICHGRSSTVSLLCLACHLICPWCPPRLWCFGSSIDQASWPCQTCVYIYISTWHPNSIYLSIFLCMYVSIHASGSIYPSINILLYNIYIYIYVCIYMCLLYTHLSIYINIHNIYIYIHTHVFDTLIHIYTYIHML